jgi:hypothetical protein
VGGEGNRLGIVLNITRNSWVLLSYCLLNRHPTEADFYEYETSSLKKWVFRRMLEYTIEILSKTFQTIFIKFPLYSILADNIPDDEISGSYSGEYEDGCLLG